MKCFFTAIVLLLFSNLLFSDDCEGRYLDDQFEVQESDNILFGNNVLENGTSVDLHLNVYTPKGDALNDRPLLIYLHGGSFVGGDKDMFESTAICKALTKKGYVTASIDYRLEPSYISLIFPEVMIKAVIRAVQDAKAAVRFFRKDIAENGNNYGIDPEKIFIGGASAGSIAALHLAYLDDLNELDSDFRNYAEQLGGLEGESGNPGYSSRVKGVINVSGAIKEISYMNNNTDIPVLSIHSPGDLSIPYISGRPYFIPTLPIVQGSKRIHEQAIRKGISSILYTVPGFVHIPYGNSPEALNPVVFDSSIVLMSKFLYDNIECSATPTQVQDHQTSTLSIYPNPASSGCWIKNDTEDKKLNTVSVVNTLGQVLSVINLDADKVYIPLQGLSPGQFFLQFSDTKGNISTVKLLTVL